MATQSQFDSYVVLQFKAGLREMQHGLQQVIEKAEKEIRELANLDPLDSADVSCFSSSKEAMFADSSRNRSRLRVVQLALERIGNGSFGICAECEATIGLKRLQAVPWATYCIECQEQLERGQTEQL